MRLRLGDHAFDRIVIYQVARHCIGAAFLRDDINNALSLFAIATMDDEPHTFARERDGNRLADPLAAPCLQGSDEMLDDIMIHWLSNSGASSAWLYWEMAQTRWSSAARIERPITAPAGFSMFKFEAVRKSRRWIKRRYINVRFFADHAEGGHFAALEQPRTMLDDIRATFAGL